MLDREIQLRILKALAAIYPEATFNVLRDIGIEDSAGVANLFYLTEHNLVSAKFSKFSGKPMGIGGQQRITAAGMDFLADDGGVGAILGVVTVKIHEDTIKQLIEARIAGSDLPEEEKRPLLQAVRELPGEAIKHLTTRLLDLGLDNLPGAVSLIRTYLPGAGG